MAINYKRNVRRQTLADPLRASTPTRGTMQLDPRKTAATPAPGGYNPQSASNALAAAAPQPNPLMGAAPQPRPAAIPQVPSYSMAVPPPPQPPSTMRSAAALPGVMPTPWPDYATGSPGSQPPPANTSNTRVIDGLMVGGAANRQFGPWADRLNTPTAPDPEGYAVPQGQRDTAVERRTGPPPASSDTLLAAALQEAMDRLSGTSTAATTRMSDRLLQQNEAQKQAVDKRIAGRGLGADNPLKLHLYGQMDRNVADQIALREAQVQEAALGQAIQAASAAQQAQYPDLYRQQLAMQGDQFNANLRANEPSMLDTGLKILGALPGVGPAISGVDALLDLIKGKPKPTQSAINTEAGFRLPPTGAVGTPMTIRR